VQKARPGKPQFQSQEADGKPSARADLIHLLGGGRSSRATQGVAGQERLSQVWPVGDDFDAFLFPVSTFCISTVSSLGKAGMAANTSAFRKKTQQPALVLLFTPAAPLHEDAVDFTSPYASRPDSDLSLQAAESFADTELRRL